MAFETLQRPGALAPSPRPSHWVRAEVRVGDHLGAYLTRGSGRLVLVLSRRDDPAFAHFCEQRAGAARVVVPVLTRRSPPVSRAWLIGLLDVFGADDATVVADDTEALEALSLALACPERIGSVLLLDGRDIARGADESPRLVPVALARYIP